MCKQPGNAKKNRFVVFVCKYPITTAASFFTLSVVMVAITINISLSNGDSFISTTQGSDQGDIRSIHHDAYIEAQGMYIKEGGAKALPKGNGWGNDVGENLIMGDYENPQSVQKDVLWLTYESKSDNVYTPEAIQVMIDLDRMVTTNPMWESYCKRTYNEEGGQMTSECEKPLNPSRLFFSDVLSQTVNLALFKQSPSDEINAILNCFMSKIRTDDQVIKCIQISHSCKIKSLEAQQQ
jgi:hypothetical protein